jgi:hypothetical protein
VSRFPPPRPRVPAADPGAHLDTDGLLRRAAPSDAAYAAAHDGEHHGEHDCEDDGEQEAGRDAHPDDPAPGAPLTVEANWILTRQQVQALRAPGLSADERLRRAVAILERLDDPEDDVHRRTPADERVVVHIPLTFDEVARTWPDARTPMVDPWLGHGEVDQANAEARRWSARYLLRALAVGPRA